MKCFPFGLALALAALGCGGDEGDDNDADAAIDVDAAILPDAAIPDAAVSDANPRDPRRLRSTGLWADFERETLAPDVVAFEPRFVLWSDAATKRRWIYIPPGERIDTSDMNFWKWPVGTRMWKEFTRDGVRVETRLLYKYGPTNLDWFMRAFAWNEAQTEAVVVPDGVENALGTDHDIPSDHDCARCHERVVDVALGASAIQLDHDGPGITLADLIANDRLTDPPPGALVVPGSEIEQAALGYLHVNCGTCHNDYSDVRDKVDMRLLLTVETLDRVASTPAYTTAVGIEPNRSVGGSLYLIEAGNAAASGVHIRMDQRGLLGMPPVGSEDVDTEGLAAVDGWIDSL